MGYLNNQIITVDAILTKKGRELISKEDGSFRITQFALSDDEIDYSLYNSSHPSGSAYYGEAIERMPIIEAFPDERYIMKYKLISLPLGTEKVPILNLGVGRIELRQGASITITPETLNYLGKTSSVESLGYQAIVSDERLLQVFRGVGLEETLPPSRSIEDISDPRIIDKRRRIITAEVAKTIKGINFILTASSRNDIFSNGETKTTGSITFLGLESGARKTIPIIITKS